MSTDLRQFFTTDHIPDKLEPNSYEKFFINALSYTSPKAIDDLTIAFEEDESDDLIQNFQEIDLLDEHVFPDVIDYEFEEVILSPFFDRNEFAVDGFETIIEGLYDEQNEVFVNDILCQKFFPNKLKWFLHSLYPYSNIIHVRSLLYSICTSHSFKIGISKQSGVSLIDELFIS